MPTVLLCRLATKVTIDEPLWSLEMDLDVSVILANRLPNRGAKVAREAALKIKMDACLVYGPVGWDDAER